VISTLLHWRSRTRLRGVFTSVKTPQD